MNKKLAKAFSKFTTNKIKAINALASTDSGVASSSSLSRQMKKADQVLGGTISSLSRTRINGNPLVIPLAKDPKQGMIWKLNNEVASKEDIAEVSDYILSEVLKWKGGMSL